MNGDKLTQDGELYFDTYAEATALCGGPTPAQHRMIQHANARYEAGRQDSLERLRALDGFPWPLCRILSGEAQEVKLIGSMLLCPDVHAWSNLDAAEEEIQARRDINAIL